MKGVKSVNLRFNPPSSLGNYGGQVGNNDGKILRRCLRMTNMCVNDPAKVLAGLTEF